MEEEAPGLDQGNEHPAWDRGHGADDIAEENGVERDGNVPFELAAAGDLDEALRDVAGRRDEPPITDSGHQQDLPDDDEPERRDQIKQALARLGGHLDVHESLFRYRVGEAQRYPLIAPRRAARG